mgnify:CR=1 FL=1
MLIEAIIACILSVSAITLKVVNHYLYKKLGE